MNYLLVLSKFALYHQSNGNVWCHLGSTLLGIVGLLSVLKRVNFVLVVAYAGALLCSEVPLDVALTTWCALAFVSVVAAKIDLGLASSVALIVLGYASQDLSHWYFGEETYQANSWGKTGALDVFMEHCFYLMPLTIECASPFARTCLRCSPLALWSWSNYALDSDTRWGLPFLVAKKRLLVGKLCLDQETKDMRSVRAWAVSQNPRKDATSHWWVDDLPAKEREAFERLVQSRTVEALFRTKYKEGSYRVEPVRGMNEVYVSNPTPPSLRRSSEKTKTSDDVFFTQHVDGPFCFFPFASVYRCILALDGNEAKFATRFPISSRDVTARNGDILAFDFHRESHYITRGETDGETDGGETDFRVVLKLHYVAAPKNLFFLGRVLRFLSVKYNQVFRALFLFTIKPASTAQSLVSDLGVNGFTVLYNAAEKYVGFGNLLFYFALAAVSYVLKSYAIFLYASQFLHYGRYLTTYYDRKNVAYGAFKRDVLLYKSIALPQLLRLYLISFHPASLAVVSVGYLVSIAATKALGVDGTYFGIELGVVKADYKFVTKFPYNVIPHPMILGQVAAILAMHLGGTALREDHPFLAPIHVALYLLHLAQEAFDLHDGTPWYKQVNAIDSTRESHHDPDMKLSNTQKQKAT